MMFHDMIRMRDLAGAWLMAAMILPKMRLRLASGAEGGVEHHAGRR